MAKKDTSDDLFEMLRARGLRKKVAGSVADAVRSAKRHGDPPEKVRRVAADLKDLADEIEDRATGGPGKRQAAARKAARTRKRNAEQRSAAAKKAARTRARSKG